MTNRQMYAPAVNYYGALRRPQATPGRHYGAPIMGQDANRAEAHGGDNKKGLLFLLAFAVLLIFGLCIMWHRTFADTSCIGPGCRETGAVQGHDSVYGSRYGTGYSSDYGGTRASRSSNGGSSSNITVVGILIIIVLAALGFCMCGNRGGTTSRDINDTHRVYPPSSFAIAAFAPIVGAAVVGVSFFGLIGFLAFLFLGVIAALTMLNYMSSAPEVAGGGAYIKS